MILERIARSARNTAKILAVATAAACGGGGGGGIVDPDNKAPVCSISAPTQAARNTQFTAQANCTDSDGHITGNEWNPSNGSSASATYTASGTSMNIQVRARDNAGAWSNWATANVAVTDAPIPLTANNINLSVLEDSVKTHNLAASVSGAASGATYALLDVPSDVNASVNGSNLTFGGDADVNGSRNFRYVVRNPDGKADTANINLTINPMTDYRFALREFFSKQAITEPWSMKINGETKNAVNGIVEGQITPGTYDVELATHSGTFPADRIERGSEVKILFPKFSKDPMTFNSDFTATTYRPSRTNANFNDNTLPSWLAIYDDEAFGVRVPLNQNQTSYINTSSASGMLNCLDMSTAVRDQWRVIQNELVQKFGQYYSISTQEGIAPPTKTNNDLIIAADNTQALCQNPTAHIAPHYDTTLRHLLSSRAYIPSANLVTARVEAFVYWSGGLREDNENRGFSFFDRNHTATDLTNFDLRAIEIGQAYARPAGIRRVQNNGATPFFSLR